MNLTIICYIYYIYNKDPSLLNLYDYGVNLSLSNNGGDCIPNRFVLVL